MARRKHRRHKKVMEHEKKCYPNCDVSIWLRSCIKEETKPIQGTITGYFPDWIDGSLLRNGPGNLKFGEMEFKHLFDCSALLHKFRIKDGQVTYQNKFLECETYKKNKSAQRIVMTEFGTSGAPDPCRSIFKRIASVFHTESKSDNAMISIYPFGDEYFALTEIPLIHQIDPSDLSTKRRIDAGESLGIVNHTSHPHVMPDGTVYNLAMAPYKTGLKHCIVEYTVDKDDQKVHFEKGRIIGTAPVRQNLCPSYMHSFGITENYFVVVEQPLCVSITTMVKNTIMDQPLATALQWFSDEPTYIVLISRKTEKVTHKFRAESFFYLHIINQYEEEDQLILDICCYKDPSMLNCMYIESLRHAQENLNYAEMFRGRPLRFKLPLNTDSIRNKNTNEDIYIINNLMQQNLSVKTTSEAIKLETGEIFVVPELLCDLGCETPRINYNLSLGRDYTYFYAIASDVDSENPGTLIKVNVKDKTSKTWSKKGVFASEPIFIPHPNSQTEDDGVIVSSIIYSGERVNESGIVVLDAQTWQEIGFANFKTQGPVPKCLHGWFASKV